MWLSTKRERQQFSIPSTSTGEVSSATSDVMEARDGWKSCLPLDWTRMDCRDQVLGGKKASLCCINPHTCSCRGRMRVSSTKIAANPPSVTMTRNRNGNDIGTGSPNKIDGRAIFCLHDDDPGWIQGYFIPQGSKKPLGILAIQEEIDSCVACCAGGYRQLSLTVYHYSYRDRQKAPSSIGTKDFYVIRGKKDKGRKNSSKIDGVVWTGGDMIRLHHPRYVDMKAEKILTGQKCLPVLHKFFQELINRLERECRVKKGTSVLKWLPNIAIVMGPMSLELPLQ